MLEIVYAESLTRITIFNIGEELFLKPGSSRIWVLKICITMACIVSEGKSSNNVILIPMDHFSFMHSVESQLQPRTFPAWKEKNFCIVVVRSTHGSQQLFRNVAAP